MATAGKKLEDEEIASYILAGLDMDFNPTVSSMASRVEPLSLGKLYTQLVSWEQLMDLLHGGSGSSANAATPGGQGANNRGNGRSNGSNADRPTCQLCGKEGHTVLRCYRRFDASFTGPPEQ